MRLIHCSDLHLDASLRSRFDAETACRRRAEILHTFRRMTRWASSNRVRGILLCGDLFDTETPSASAVSAVESVITEYPSVLFFYLRGNHDGGCPLFEGRSMPDNLYMFDSDWRSIDIGHSVRITARENAPFARSGGSGAEDGNDGPFDLLSIDPRRINLVMLHGQICEGYLPKDEESVPLAALRGKGIDYLALGHLHTYREFPLDQRGVAVYSGCLEGRGFDECGEKGFVLIEIDDSTGALTHQFVPFASRRLFEITCEVTGCRNVSEISGRIENQLRDKTDLRSSDIVRLLLDGELEEGCFFNTEYLRQEWEDRFFYLEIADCTKPLIHVEDYLGDVSLKGEFVRTVCTARGAKEISAERQNEILRCGLRALAGRDF